MLSSQTIFVEIENENDEPVLTSIFYFIYSKSNFKSNGGKFCSWNSSCSGPNKVSTCRTWSYWAGLLLFGLIDFSSVLLQVFEAMEDTSGVVGPKYNLAPPHYDGIQSLFLAGDLLLSGSRDTCIKKWDLAEQRMQQVISHKPWFIIVVVGMTFSCPHSLGHSSLQLQYSLLAQNSLQFDQLLRKVFKFEWTVLCH